MSPFLDNDLVCFHLKAPSARLTRGPLESFLVFAGIGAQKLREIGVDKSIPCDSEYYARRRSVFPHDGRTRGDFMDGVPIAGRSGTPRG